MDSKELSEGSLLNDFSAEQIKYIFSNTGDAVCIISSSGRLLGTNPAAEKLFGISADKKTKIWNAIPYIEGNDDLIQLFIDAVSKKMISHEAIVKYMNNEGEKKDLHVRLTCFKEDLMIFLAIITDLTELFKVNSAFARYTSPDIAEYVLSSPDGEKRGGKNKNVSILMSDLRGFTALSTKLSSNELIVLLNHYFEKMAAVIAQYGGTIIEFLGDGIFVVFGAPKDMPDHAYLAVKCAVEMENAMEEVNRWNSEMGYPTLEMGIGINSGPVVVGNIGSENKMKYGCIGATVNIAGRLESLTVGGQVYITENTRALITEELNISNESSFLPKGASTELKYFEIQGIGEEYLKDASSKEIEWKEYSVEDVYKFYKLEGKSVEKIEYIGKLSHISADKKFGIFATDLSLPDMQNIMVKIKGECAYAKVIKKEEMGYRICFTSIKKDLL